MNENRNECVGRIELEDAHVVMGVCVGSGSGVGGEVHAMVKCLRIVPRSRVSALSHSVGSGD